MDSIQKFLVKETEFFKFLPEIQYWDEDSYRVRVIDADYKAMAFSPVKYTDMVSGTYVNHKVHFVFDKNFEYQFMDDCVPSISTDVEYISYIKRSFTVGNRLLQLYLEQLENDKNPEEMLKALKYVVIVQTSKNAELDEEEQRVIYIVDGDFHKLFHRLYGPSPSEEVKNNGVL